MKINHIFVLLMCFAAMLLGADDTQQRHILIISSYDQEYDWSTRQLAGIRSIFDELPEVTYHLEYLDTKFASTDDYYQQFSQLLEIKYKKYNLQGIITIDDNALNFILDHREIFGSMVPVVFTGINDFSPEQTEGYPRVSGIIDEVQEVTTLRQAAAFHPRARDIVIIHDQSESALANRERARRLIEPEFSDTHRITYLTDLTFAELKEELSRRSRESIILYWLFVRDSEGVIKGYEQSISFIAESTSAPVYQVTNLGIGSTGSVGGFVVDPFHQGRAAAENIISFDPELPYLRISSGRYHFDYQQLQSRGVPFSQAPPEAVFSNMIPPLPREYRTSLYLMSLILVILTVLVITLITLFVKQKQYARQINEHEQLVRSSIDLATYPTWVYHPDGTVLLSNRESRNLFTDIVHEGRNFFRELEVKGFGDTARLFHTLDERLLNRQPLKEDQVRRVLTARGLKKLIVSKALLQWRGSSAILTTCVDVTDQEDANERLRQAEQVRAVGLMAASIAHDFNNQLMVLEGYSDLLADGIRDEALLPYIQEIRTALNSSRELTRQLLSYARREQTSSRKLEPGSLAAQAVRTLSGSLDESWNVKMEDHLDPDTRISGNDILIQNALLNLGLNARDAMAGGGEILYTVSSREVLPSDQIYGVLGPLPPGRYVVISVTDHGTGIGTDIITSLFDPFFTTKEGGKGTGLGLSAVLTTVSQHHGDILLDTALNEGTTFNLYFPRLNPDADMDIHEKKVLDTAMVGKQHILVVDDEKLLRKLTQSILNSAGFEVTTCASGSEALEIYESGQFDLVILDMMMPGINGIETFKKIIARDPQAKVILISGFSEQKITRELYDMGLAGFMEKPVPRSIMISEVTRILQDS